MDPTIKDFESALAELDTIVKKMEEGDMTLEKSMELYERGLQLSRFCHSTLESAERRIELLNERGELRPAPPALGRLARARADAKLRHQRRADGDRDRTSCPRPVPQACGRIRHPTAPAFHPATRGAAGR